MDGLLGTLVAFGASHTDGVGSGPEAKGRLADVLFARLQQVPELKGIAVVQAGIAGNRLLRDGTDIFIGPSGLSRFRQDVLDKAGVRWVLVHMGINDLGGAASLADPREGADAERIIEGYRILIAQAHERGVAVWAGTLLPFGGMEWPYHSAAGEVERQKVNAWIRTSGAFDAVVDYDQVVRDPAHPDRLLPAYDSGDHLHPNAAGYKAMAEALDLKLFAPRR